MGEVIPSWNGDGVFTGREPTHRINQMKKNLLVITWRVFIFSLIAYSVNFWFEDKEHKVYEERFRTSIEAELACNDWSGEPFYEPKNNPRWSYQGSHGGSMRLIADANPSRYDENARSETTKRFRPFYNSRYYVVEPYASHLRLKPEYQGQGLPNIANEVYARGLCVKQSNMVLGFRYLYAYKDSNSSDKPIFYQPKLTKRFLF